MSSESLTEKKAYALKYYAAHCAASDRHEELFQFARNQVFYELQRRYFLDNVALALESVRLALQHATDVLDVPSIAEFSLLHAHRVTEIRSLGLLESFESHQIDRSRQLSQMLEPNLRALWDLLLLATLKSSGDMVQCGNLLDEMLERPPVRLAEEHEELGALLIAQLIGDKPG